MKINIFSYGLLLCSTFPLDRQFRAKVCILRRSHLGVHSLSMDQAHFVDRPEKTGLLVLSTIWFPGGPGRNGLGQLLPGEVIL